MHALSGSMQDRTTGALDAGCDVVLHCNGEMDEMVAVASVLPNLSGKALARAQAAEAARDAATTNMTAPKAATAA